MSGQKEEYRPLVDEDTVRDNGSQIPLVGENTARDGAGIPYKIVRVEAAIDIHDESLQMQLDCSGVGMAIVKGDTVLSPILAWLDEYGNTYTQEDLEDTFGFVLSEYREGDIVDHFPDEEGG